MKRMSCLAAALTRRWCGRREETDEIPDRVYRCKVVEELEEGLEAAINDRPWPGQERKLDGRQEAHLIAFACSAAPEGHTHWTLQLLADQVVELEFAESISLETVRQILKKTNSSPGRRKSGVSPR